MNRKFGLQYTKYKITPETRAFPVTWSGVRLVWAKDFDEACTKGFPEYQFVNGKNHSKVGHYMDENGFGEGIKVFWNGLYSDNLDNN